MNKWTLLMIFLFFNIFSIFAQTEWANNYGGSNLDQGVDLQLDNFGNIYTTGFFEGTADFDPSSNNTVNLNSVGLRDFYIAKYDVIGQLAWAKSIGGSSQEYSKSMQIDDAGNIYVVGDFNGLVDFDPSIGFSLQDVKGASDIFIAKYDPQGNFIWVKTFGGIGIESSKDLIVDSQGDIYIAGVFQGTADFDPNGGVVNLTSTGSFDSFILKLDNNGNFGWVKSIQGTNSNFINQIVLDYAGNINAVGYFQGTADFDPNAGVSTMTTIGSKSAFLSKWNGQGQFVSALMIGGSGFEIGKALTVDMQNNIYMVGDFRGVVDFDPSGSTNFITSSGLRDAFIVKYTSQGVLVWVDKIGGAGEDQVTSIATGQNNEIYVSGYFNASMTLSNNKTYASSGNADAFFARYSQDGNLNFATKNGGANGDESTAIVANAFGEVFSTGWIQGTSNFGNQNLQSHGDRDIFLAKIKMESSNSTNATLLNETLTAIFPNPNNGQFTLSLTDLESKNLSISIIDLSGKQIFNQVYTTTGLSKFQTMIELNSIQSGLYIMRIEGDRESVTKKIVIK
jgi:hypothetical protein